MSIPDIEKEFGFSSSSAGIILASNDIAGIILVPLVSFWGTHGRKPKWIGIGGITTGSVSKIFSPLAYIVFDNSLTINMGVKVMVCQICKCKL